MSYYKIKFSCGHEGEVKIIGGNSQTREAKAKWYEGELCKECYKKMMAEKKIEDEKKKGIIIPDFITGYWNGKIYGYGETKSIYIDGDKIELTKDQLEELEEYKKALDENWNIVP